MLPKTYLRQVRRRLYLPPALCRQELQALTARLHSGIQAGVSWEEMEKSMGTPEDTAAAIQARYPQYEKNPWRFLFLLPALTGAVGLLWTAALQLLEIFLRQYGASVLASSSSSVGIIGGADGPTAIFVTASPRTSQLPEMILFLLLIPVGFSGWRKLRCRRAH